MLARNLLFRAGPARGALLAFPAGNSGVGLWFVHAGRVSWTLRAPPVAVHDSDSRGRVLYGISAQATLEGQELQIRQAVLSSIRVLRDYQLLGTMPSVVAAISTEHGRTLSWARDRLDGAAGDPLVLEGTPRQPSGGHIRAGPPRQDRVRVPGPARGTPPPPLVGPVLLQHPAPSHPP